MTNELIGMLGFPAILMIAAILTRRRPSIMRRFARTLLAVAITALCCIILTGLGHGHEPAAAIHKWLSHGLLDFIWYAVPLATGVILAMGRRLATALVQVIPCLMMPGVLFLASVTGYLGPSYGPVDEMSLQRFRLLHQLVIPVFSMILAISSYCGIGHGESPSVGDAFVQSNPLI